MIGVDTSVIVRYLVGTPAGQAKRAAALIEGEAIEVGVSVVALAECAHVLRTQYGVEQREIIDSLIDFIQRENVWLVDGNPDLLVSMLVGARTMPGRLPLVRMTCSPQIHLPGDVPHSPSSNAK